MTSADDTATKSEEWVIIASFENRHAAEQMLTSLGHESGTTLAPEVRMLS